MCCFIGMQQLAATPTQILVLDYTLFCVLGLFRGYKILNVRMLVLSEFNLFNMVFNSMYPLYSLLT